MLSSLEQQLVLNAVKNGGKLRPRIEDSLNSRSIAIDRQKRKASVILIDGARKAMVDGYLRR
jgi:hypothetical protein